jgi:hypothetical protein
LFARRSDPFNGRLRFPPGQSRSPVPRSRADAITVMIFGVGGMFRPGFLTPAQAEELNRMRAALAALDRLGTVPPLTVTRLANGQPVIGMGAGAGGGAGSFWAEITAEGGGPTAYSWKKIELLPSGLFGDADPAVTGELNAYAIPGVTVSVGDIVRMYLSPTKASAFEFTSGVGSENSFDIVTEWEIVEDAGDCTIVPSLVRTITGSFTVGDEHAP